VIDRETIKNGVGILLTTPPGYRTDGGVGWLAGARFPKLAARGATAGMDQYCPKIPGCAAYSLYGSMQFFSLDN
jgi:hypothetical protein